MADAAHRTGQAMENAKDTVKEKASEAYDYTAEKASDLKESMSNAAHKTGQALTDAKDTVKEKASDAYEYTAQKASDLKESVSRAAERGKSNTEEVDDEHQVGDRAPCVTAPPRPRILWSPADFQ